MRYRNASESSAAGALAARRSEPNSTRRAFLPDVARALDQLLDETRPPVDDDQADDTAYDVVLDYGDHEERLRYGEDELPGDIREALDARLKRGYQRLLDIASRGRTMAGSSLPRRGLSPTGSSP